MQEVQQAAQEVQSEQGQAEVAKAEVEKAIANLETDRAQFEAKVAKELANLTKLEAKITVDAIQNENDGVIEGERMQMNTALAEQMAQAVLAIQQLAAQFNNQAVQAMNAINQNAENKPKILKIVQERVNGKLEAVPVYE